MAEVDHDASSGRRPELDLTPPASPEAAPSTGAGPPGTSSRHAL